LVSVEGFAPSFDQDLAYRRGEPDFRAYRIRIHFERPLERQLGVLARNQSISIETVGFQKFSVVFVSILSVPAVIETGLIAAAAASPGLHASTFHQCRAAPRQGGPIVADSAQRRRA
jgi:hypothetical protein